MQKESLSRLFLLLSGLFLLSGMAYFGYFWFNRMEVQGMEEEKTALEQHLGNLKEEQRQLRNDHLRLEETFHNRNHRFMEKFGFTLEDLQKADLNSALEKVQKEQGDILAEMFRIIIDSRFAYESSAYEDEDLIQLLSRYMELSSRSDLEKKEDSLLKGLSFSKMTAGIMKDGTFHTLLKECPYGTEDKELLTIHLFSLSYPLYELSLNRGVKDPDDLVLPYILYVDRLESLNSQFPLEINLDFLRDGRTRLTQYYYKYREYDGIKEELVRMKEEQK